MTAPLPYEPIASAQYVAPGTVADLRMENGRVYRCAWTRYGRVTAWWPLAGPRIKPIGLYEPAEWRIVDAVIAIGAPR